MISMPAVSRINIHKQQGLSLVELMVAVTLSLFLMLGIFQIFNSSKQTSRVQDALARVQENARFALDIITNDIRMAGQRGCNHSASVANNSGRLADLAPGFVGFEFTDLGDGKQAGALLIGKTEPTADEVIEDSDVIVIRAASPRAYSVDEDTDLATIKLASAFPVPGGGTGAGLPFIVSDCEGADIFTANNIAGANVTVNGNLSRPYKKGAELAELNYIAYYIKVDDETKLRNLYRLHIDKGENAQTKIFSEPLIEGVENMQILYGEDINGDGNLIRYVDANEADMDKVTSIRVHLLLSTLENNLSIGQSSYWFKNELTDAAEGDRRLFRTFTSTIQLRNKGLGA